MCKYIYYTLIMIKTKLETIVWKGDFCSWTSATLSLNSMWSIYTR